MAEFGPFTLRVLRDRHRNHPDDGHKCHSIAISVEFPDGNLRRHAVLDHSIPICVNQDFVGDAFDISKAIEQCFSYAAEKIAEMMVVKDGDSNA
jgi:hypothetical protein